MNVLVINPGGNSLKVEIVSCQPDQKTASEGKKLINVAVEGIGKTPRLFQYAGKKIEHSEAIEAESYGEASVNILAWLERHSSTEIPRPDQIDCVGIRVVHGGPGLTHPARITAEVEREILDLARWAPLHNQRSMEVMPSIRSRLPKAPCYAVFDTAFHRTIPEFAGLYAIPLELSQKYNIHRYGFHGISHRYMLERYAHLVKRSPTEMNLVTMHLESGCSVTAISKGHSLDNTMGLTPLEGLMMGTRSGDVDPALLVFLGEVEELEISEVLNLLNTESGLLGVSGKSLDTRVLMKEYETNSRVKLAMEMFSYRVLKAVGAYACALGGIDAVIFGGGIAENTPLVRKRVCEGLRWCGLEMDVEQNLTLIDVEGRLSTERSRIQAYVIPVQEGLQIAHECAAMMKGAGD